MDVCMKLRHPGPGKVALAGLIAACAAGFLAQPASAVPAGAVHRPISDFVDAQGTTAEFFPPVRDYLGTSDPARSIFALIDYAGLAAQWLAGNGVTLGTTTDGTITERPLPDGRAEVHVLLRTANALAWATDLADPNGPLLFGHRASEVAGGAEPALGSSIFNIVFINTAPGAPMPDLVAALVFGPAPLGFEPRFLRFQVVADGPLGDGSPGHMTDVQNGLFFPRGRPFQLDSFPAEHILIGPAGGGLRHGDAAAAPARESTTWGAIKDVYRR